MENLSSVQTWLYDNLPVGVAILDRHLVYRYTNAAYSATQGYAAPQLLARPLELGPSDWVARITDLAVQARETRRAIEAFDVTLTYPRQPTLQRTWDLTLLPLFQENELDGYVLYLVDVTSRRQAEQLRTSETRLRSILDVAADAIFVVDESGTILQANQAVTRIFGYETAELIGHPLTTIMPESFAIEHPRFLERYLHTGIPHIIGTIREVEGQRKDGTRFPCELSVAESRESRTRRIFIGIIRDITERKAVEEELRKFSRTVEQSPSVVMITDKQGHIEYVNPKFAMITGYQPEEVLGKTPSILKSGETSAEEYDRLWATIGNGEEWRGEFHNKKKNGELYWESASISPIRDAKGHITHYLAVKEDITERKRLEAELLAARARLEAILNTVPLPLLVLNTEGKIILSNEAATEFYGENAAELDKLVRLPRLHPDTRRPWPIEEWALFRALREGKVVSDVEQIIVFPDGTEVPVLVHAAPVVVDSHTIAAVAVLQDLTQLKAADRAKDAFLALISHELKSPLATIISWADLAREDQTLCDEALQVVLRNAHAQRRIIDDLLDVSKVFYGKLTLEKAPLDAWEIAARAAEAMRMRIEERQLTLVLTAPPTPLPVLADSVRLTQVITNLLTNAMKFTQPGGTITLAGAREGDMAVLRVSDTGAGIAPEQLPAIFQRFQQLGRERVSGGLGLGLALVKGIVELHDGRVEAASPGVGQGSTFTVRLPLRA